MNVLIESRSGMEVMLASSLVYLVVIWRWSPNKPAIDFHNKALRFNHLAAFLFVLVCEVLNRVDLSPTFAIVMVYVSLVLLCVVCVICCVRIYVEYKFRQRLEERPDLLECGKKELIIEDLTGAAKL